MLLVDFGSANHREKSATPATYNHKYALFMPHSCHDIDSISLKNCGDIASFHLH